MSDSPETPSEWTAYFDRVWELTDWLSDYGTVYYRPSSDEENAYNSPPELAEEERPDVVVDFDNHDHIVSCFFVDAEDLEHLTNELTQYGRFGSYALSKYSVTINKDDSDTPRTPDGDLLVTQFAPFGSVLFDTISVPNLEANEGMNNISEQDDFITFLIGNMLNRNLSTAKTEVRSTDEYDPFDTYHGVLAGSPFGDESRQMPTALVSPHPDEHDFWYAYWERYNNWH